MGDAKLEKEHSCEGSIQLLELQDSRDNCPKRKKVCHEYLLNYFSRFPPSAISLTYQISGTMIVRHPLESAAWQ
jgi:hypothetical protein